MTLDNVPTAAMIDELKSRLAECDKPLDDLELACSYLNYVERLLRRQGEDRRVAEDAIKSDDFEPYSDFRRNELGL